MTVCISGTHSDCLNILHGTLKFVQKNLVLQYLKVKRCSIIHWFFIPLTATTRIIPFSTFAIHVETSVTLVSAFCKNKTQSSQCCTSIKVNKVTHLSISIFYVYFLSAIVTLTYDWFYPLSSFWHITNCNLISVSQHSEILLSQGHSAFELWCRAFKNQSLLI